MPITRSSLAARDPTLAWAGARRSSVDKIRSNNDLQSNARDISCETCSRNKACYPSRSHRRQSSKNTCFSWKRGTHLFHFDYEVARYIFLFARKLTEIFPTYLIVLEC